MSLSSHLSHRALTRHEGDGSGKRTFFLLHFSSPLLEASILQVVFEETGDKEREINENRARMDPLKF